MIAPYRTPVRTPRPGVPQTFRQGFGPFPDLEALRAAAQTAGREVRRAGRTVTVEQADTSFRVYDAGQLLIEVTPTTTKTIARFKARKPEPPRQRQLPSDQPNR